MMQYNRYFTAGSLGRRLLFAFIGIISVSLTIIVGTLIWQIRATFTNQIGQSFLLQATSTSQQLGVELGREIELLHNLSQDEAFAVRITQTSETELANLSADERVALLKKHDQEWQQGSDSPLHDFIMVNSASNKLNDFNHNFPSHSQLMVIDRYGGLVATTNGVVTPRYYYADEPWWGEVWQNQFLDTPYVGNPQVESSQTTVDIALPVVLPHTLSARGALRSRFIIQNLKAFANVLPLGKTGELMLTDANGLVLYSSNPNRLGQRLQSGNWQQILASPSTWQVAANEAGQAMIVSHVTLTASPEHEYLEKLGWKIIVQQTESEALAVVNTLSEFALLGGMVTLLLAIVISGWMASQFARPLKELTEVAVSMSGGQLTHHAAVTGPTEVQTLARAFNNMTDQLRGLIGNLEHQVAERTQELQLALGETQSLFKAAQAILGATELRSICQNLIVHFNQLVQANQMNLYLVDHERREISLYVEDGTILSNQHITYEILNTGISGLVFSNKQPILSLHADDGIEPENTREQRRRADVGSLIVVPLVAKGQVIGTITALNRTDQREFTPHDVDLLMALATQAATAIENARLYAELAKLNADKDKFFSIVAHDLKGPFMPLLGTSELLMEMAEFLKPDDIKDMGTSINRSARNVFALLENLLHWSRLQQGRMEYQPQLVDLHALAAGNVQLLHGNAQSKGIELLSLVPEGIFVYADSFMLDTVIRNLTSNALKFTPQGGQVTISAQVSRQQTADQRVEDRRQTVDTNTSTPYGLPSTHYIEVSIADTGVGMPPHVKEKLFKIDQHVTTIGTNKETGTGLGLIICQEMVVKSGGRIWVESEVGRGTTVRFTVRLDEV